MQALTLSSPAKLNLFLRIIRRRSDGYHDLVTVFHRISLADTLGLRKQKEGFSLTCSHSGLPTGESNLVTKAYRLLQKRYPKLGGVAVRLQKKVPLGAGLGGGSSNAAFFLLGMEQLYGLKISKKELAKMGGTLGADVPFFIEGINQAIAAGRGDTIQPRVAKGKLWFVLILSNKGLSTKEIYENFPKIRRPLSLTKEKATAKLLCNFLEARKFGRVASLLRNDLEIPAFRLRPSLRKIIAQFNALGVKTSRMSGSGATVFAIVSDRREALRVARVIKPKLPACKIVVCHTF